MDEMVNENEVVEESVPAEETFDSGITDAEFDEMWDNDEDNDEMFAEEITDEADQQTQGSPETEETEPTEAEQPDGQDTDQYLELKHFDEVKKVNKEQAKVLAQKGMDYDRIRERADKLQKYEDFLNEIKGDFASLEDLMDDTRARLKADKDGISYEDALAKVKEQPEQAKQGREELLEQIRRESVDAFAKAHPELKPDDIPQEVWEDIFQTNNLEASYIKYQAKKTKDENAFLKKNAENKARSTGSMKSDGKPT